MNKKIMLRIIFTIMLIIHFIVIFQFSSQNGKTSTVTSTRTMYKIIDVINGDKEVTKEEVEMYEPILRKLAHFGIYTFVGIWGMCLMSTFFEKNDENKRLQLQLKSAILIGFIYACSDEIHQLFSEGRSAEITDIIIDTLGVALGAVIVACLLKICNKNK